MSEENSVVIRVKSVDDSAASREATKVGFSKMADDVAKDTDKRMGDAGKKSGESYAKNAQASAQKGMGGFGAAIAAGIAAAGGPAVGAAMVGVGVLGLAALGAVLQKGSPQIQAGWTKLAADAKGAGQAASIGMVAPIASALTQIDQLIVAQEPRFKSMFDAAGADIAPLTGGLVDLASNALPGLDAAMQHSLPIAQALGRVEGAVGVAVGDLGHAVADNSRQMGSDLNQVGDTVKTLGGALGTLTGITTGLGAGALPVLNGALSVAAGMLKGLHDVLGPLEPLIGGVALAGVAGWKLLPPAMDLAASASKAVAGGLLNVAAGIETTAPRLSSLALGAGSMVETMGPLGIALAAVAAGAVLFGIGSSQAAPQVADLSQQIVQLGTAAPDAVGGLVSGNKDLQDMAGSLANVGSSVQQFGKAFSGSTTQAQQFTYSLVAQQKALGDQQSSITQTVTDSESGNTATAKLSVSTADLTDMVNKHAIALSDLTPAQQAAVNQYNDFNRVVPQAQNALKNVAAAQEITNQQLASQGIVLSTATKGWNTYGQNVLAVSTNFNQATSGVKNLTDATVAADTGFFSAQQSMQSLDQAVVSANSSVQSAAVGIASASHGIGTAQNATKQAVYSYQQSIVAVQAAEKAEGDARIAALKNIVALQQQATDAAFSQKDAQLQVLDAQNAVNAAGLGSTSLASLGGPTAANEASYKLVLSLAEAQQHLAEVTGSAAQSSQDYQTAQAAGVNGSQQVITAAQQAAAAVHAEDQAHQAVTDAQYAEQQAQQQLTQAKTAYQGALGQLTVARAADSRSTDTSTAAGARNFGMIEQLFEANFKATGSIGDATTATENQTTAMGFSAGAVQGVIDRVTGLNGMSATFGIVGLPSVNVGSLISAAEQQGLSPTDLGFTAAQMRGTNLGQGGGGRFAYAGGGLVQGSGSGTSDSIPAVTDSGDRIRVSDGEYIVNAAATRNNFQLIETINKSGRGYASGGPVGTGAAVLKANIMLSEVGGMVGVLGGAYGLIGYRGLPHQPTQNPASAAMVDWGSGAAGGGSLAASSGVAAAAQAYAASRLGAFGWGPDQMPPLVRLWNQESGWNPNAVNPSSGAYGIPQSLGHGHPYNLGDYVAQVDWGLPYISGRYGSPAAAWGHEQAMNWYGGGGITGAGLSVINDRGGELVTLPNGSQVTSAATAAGAVRDSIGAAGAGGGVLSFAGNLDTVMATAIMKLVRQGSIQLVANGQRVQVG